MDVAFTGSKATLNYDLFLSERPIVHALGQLELGSKAFPAKLSLVAETSDEHGHGCVETLRLLDHKTKITPGW